MVREILHFQIHLSKADHSATYQPTTDGISIHHGAPPNAFTTTLVARVLMAA